jgi:hypothetical protein
MALRSSSAQLELIRFVGPSIVALLSAAANDGRSRFGLQRASSLLSRLQYFVGGHLGAITPVAPQTITPAPSAWKRLALAAPIPDQSDFVAEFARAIHLGDASAGAGA